MAWWTKTRRKHSDWAFERRSTSWFFRRTCRPLGNCSLTHSFNHPSAVARARTYVHRVLTEHRLNVHLFLHKAISRRALFCWAFQRKYARERAYDGESERRRENNRRTEKKLEHTVARIDVKQHPNHYMSPLFSTLQRFRVNALKPNEREWKKWFEFEQGKVTIMNTKKKTNFETIRNFIDHELMQQQIKYFFLLTLFLLQLHQPKCCLNCNIIIAWYFNLLVFKIGRNLTLTIGSIKFGIEWAKKSENSVVVKWSK